MAFQPRMTSTISGISIQEDLRWRRWNGVIADVWHVHCAAGGGGYYVGQDARLFVVLDGGKERARMRLSTGRGDIPACRTPVHMNFVPADMPLWSSIETAGELRHLDLHFDQATLNERLGEEFDKERLATPQLGFMDDRIYSLARLIAQECLEPEARHDLYGDSLVMALFIDLMRHGPSRTPKQATLSPRQLRRVTAFIEENCLHNIRLQELAELANLSQSYFSHAFKAATGLPPYQWHMRARMRRVEQMLADPARSLTEIAMAAGFADQAHFTHAFRRFHNITPAAWRRAHRG